MLIKLYFRILCCLWMHIVIITNLILNYNILCCLWIMCSILCCLGMLIIGVNPGFLWHQQGQQNDYPCRKSIILCCSGMMYFWPSNWPILWRKRNNQYCFVLLSTRLNKFWVAWEILFFWAAKSWFLTTISCSWNVWVGSTVRGLQETLTQGIWGNFPNFIVLKNTYSSLDTIIFCMEYVK